MKTVLKLLLIFFIPFKIYTQEIKSIYLKQLGVANFSRFIPLGSVLQLSFDDLDADNKDYQYKIEQMTYDWQPSDLIASQYISGFDQEYITDVTNSFNTLQTYTHYKFNIPNQNTRITKSGNYLISILDDDDNIIFNRRVVFYEKSVLVGVNTEPARSSSNFNQEQNVKVIVQHKSFKINNPIQEVKVVILQNNNFNLSILNTRPQSFGAETLIYSYLNKNNFSGGNEYRYFDNKNIKLTNNRIAKTEMKSIYHNYLYTDVPWRSLPYSYNPDVNGNFIIRNIEVEDPSVEADYSKVFFTLNQEELIDKDIYIVGLFNNYQTKETNKMIFSNGLYNAQINLKQGFYNYKYLVVGKDKNKESAVSSNYIDGSFFETENEYQVLVYYRPFGGLYDRVIGFGNGFVKN